MPDTKQTTHDTNTTITTRLKAINISPIEQIIQPGPAHFAMVEKTALHNLDQLMTEDIQAARIIVTLIRLMEPGTNGVVVISNQALQDLLNISKSTVTRAMRTIINGEWARRIRIGGAYALAVNKDVAWIGSRNNDKHAVFQATVVAARSEQDQAALNTAKPLRQLPMAHPKETILAVGTEPEPPAQKRIDGTESLT